VFYAIVVVFFYFLSIGQDNPKALDRMSCKDKIYDFVRQAKLVKENQINAKYGLKDSTILP